MIALATEIYYGSSAQEREALCEQALAMARRLGDERVLLETLLAVPLGVWSPASADQRHAADRRGRRARPSSSATASSLATALALQASAASESGRIAGLLDLVPRPGSRRRKERQLFAQLFLDGLEIPWRAMRGEWDRDAAS